MLSADGSGVPYRRRAVNFRCGRYLAHARSSFCFGCGQPLVAFRERPGEQERQARVGHHQVVRRVWGTGVTAVTVYLAHVLVVLSRLT